MNRIMLDLETLGTRPGSIIVSIGAVRFGVGTILDDFYARIDARDGERLGMKMDARTVQWWLKQSNEARLEIAEGGELLAVVLGKFTQWALKSGEVTDLWGNGVDFDNAHLEEAYRIAGLLAPWEFKTNRCYRTVKRLFPDVRVDRLEGVRHHALDDARFQAIHLMAIEHARLNG